MPVLCGRFLALRPHGTGAARGGLRIVEAKTGLVFARHDASCENLIAS